MKQIVAFFRPISNHTIRESNMFSLYFRSVGKVVINNNLLFCVVQEVIINLTASVEWKAQKKCNFEWQSPSSQVELHMQWKQGEKLHEILITFLSRIHYYYLVVISFSFHSSVMCQTNKKNAFHFSVVVDEMKEQKRTTKIELLTTPKTI